MIEPMQTTERRVVKERELKPIHVDVAGKPKLEEKPEEEWTFDEWMVMTKSEGVDPEDPDFEKRAALMRKARQAAMDRNEIERPKAPIYLIRHNGQVVHPEEVAKMSAGELRELHVGSTCSHFEHDVPGMSDFH